MPPPTHKQTPSKQVAMLNQTESPFLRLPPEIRNRVCVYVFAYPPVNMGTSFSGMVRAVIPNSLSLLLTCRQLYHEAAMLPYKTLTFYFAFPGDVESFLVHRTRAQMAALANLEFEKRAFLHAPRWLHGTWAPIGPLGTNSSASPCVTDFDRYFTLLIRYWGRPEDQGWTVQQLKGLKSVSFRWLICESVQGQTYPDIYDEVREWRRPAKGFGAASWGAALQAAKLQVVWPAIEEFAE